MTCRTGFVVAFSCKGRGVCPSCYGRHMAQTAAHLADHVIPPVPVRQWVISVPTRLRGMLADRPRAVAALTKIFLDEIERFPLAASGGAPDAEMPRASRPRLGGISFLHRFGSVAWFGNPTRSYSSTTDSHFSWPPLTVLSNTKSQHHTSFGASACRRWHPFALEPRRRFLRFFTGTFRPSRCHRRNTRDNPARHPLLKATSQSGDTRTVASPSPTAASASPAAPRPCGAWPRIADCSAADRSQCMPFARRRRTSFEARRPPLASGK
jgi:hypothetical protein